MSEDDLLDLLLMMKNANTAPTTSTEMIIPAMAPPLIPDFPPSPEPPFDGLPELRFRLVLVAGGVPGGGGGAGPELQEFPSFLKIVNHIEALWSHNLFFYES